MPYLRVSPGRHARALREDEHPDAGGEPLAPLVEHLVHRAVAGAAIDRDALQQPATPSRPAGSRGSRASAPRPAAGIRPSGPSFPRSRCASTSRRARPRAGCSRGPSTVQSRPQSISASHMFVRGPGAREVVQRRKRQPAEQHDDEPEHQRIEEQDRRVDQRQDPLDARDLAPRGDVFRHPAVARFSPAGGTGWRCAGTGAAAQRAARAGSRARARRPPSPDTCSKNSSTGPRSAASRVSASA